MDSRLRAFSSPDLPNIVNPNPPSTSQPQQQPSQDYNLEGISANVKLLLKVIQDHNEASSRNYDDRKPQRVAGMITILDDIKGRLEKSQSSTKKRVAQLRRCNTDLRPNRGVQKPEKKPDVILPDDKEKLKKLLTASLAARKSLEMLCSSLGKEKEIMGAELARRVSELSEMEEMVNLLKAQNDTLLSKLKSSSAAVELLQDVKDAKQSSSNHNSVATTEKEDPNNNNNIVALQERNKVLTDQLLKTLESYKGLKKKFKSAKEESSRFRATVEEEATAGLARIRSLKSTRMNHKSGGSVDIDGEICALEEIFQKFVVKVSEDPSNREEKR
ncbi:hypothetical protein LINGRAPRIM_LOCUS1205 [Linum grandiflorum]